MASLMLVNPKGQLKTKARRKVKSAAANPRPRRKARRNPTAMAKRRRRRSRRNPVAMANPRRRRSRRNPKFSIRSIQRNAIMPAAIGGVGALALDVAFAALPIPANMKTGAIGAVAKIAGAIVLGKLAGKAMGAKTGEAVTVGAVTIQAYNLVKGFARQAMPTLPMGEYLSGEFDYNANPGIGYMNAGQFVPDMSGAIPYYGGDAVMGEYLSDTDYSESYS